MISPGEWYDYRAVDYVKGPSFTFKTCRHLGDNIYTYGLLGAKDLVEGFNPDWLYVQAEPGSYMAESAIDWKAGKRALFTWENISIKRLGGSQLEKYDLIICGNPAAVELVTPYNDKTALMLQVGVETDHFMARPSVERNIEVGYIGRPAPEKGLPYLVRAWPTVKTLEWADFLQLPWSYSQIQVLVAYSQDTPNWREQAPNYVVLEALSCGSKVVISDTEAMDYWLEGCPGHIVVLGHNQPDDTLRMERVDHLRRGIKEALGMEVGEEARDWIIERFSNQVMAKKLLEALENA